MSRSALSHLLNDRLNSASFSAWAPLLAEQPRLAHEAYHWDPKEDTMKKILIATDGSESAHEALEFGLELAEEQGATPFVVHVAPAVEVLPYASFAAPAPTVPHELDEQDRAPLQRSGRARGTKGHSRSRRSCLSGIRRTRSSPSPTRSKPI